MAQLAAPVEVHDEPTAPMSAARLEQEIARSRLARGSAELDVPIDSAPDVMVRTFAGRHPWLVTALLIAAAVVVAFALKGTAGP